MKILNNISVHHTGNDTPNRHWDYVASVDGKEEEFSGMGKTPEEAIRELLVVLSYELGDME